MKKDKQELSISRPGPLKSAGLDHGMSQVSLVETALSPLDYQPDTPIRHVSDYFYIDRERKRRKASVVVSAPGGLSPTDELTLYGLLAITFADAKPVLELTATPHFLCRQLGLPVGGDHYDRLRESIHRLSLVHYHNTAWWDRQKSEHRDIGFHFLSHDLPTKVNEKVRAKEPWTIIWNPLFFRLLVHSQGFVWFDFVTYRDLKQPAARRGFLLLQKIFHHRETTPRFDLRSFAVHQLGYSPNLELKSIRQKICKIIEIWQDLGIVAKNSDMELFFQKESPGKWSLCLPRGERFEQKNHRPWLYTKQPQEHPAWDLLTELGLTPHEINLIFANYSEQIIYVTRAAILARTYSSKSKDRRSRFYQLLNQNHDEKNDLILSWPLHQLYLNQKHGAKNDHSVEVSGITQDNEIQQLFHFPPFQEWLKGENE